MKNIKKLKCYEIFKLIEDKKRKLNYLLYKYKLLTGKEYSEELYKDKDM